jgi:hypothetical protein
MWKEPWSRAIVQWRGKRAEEEKVKERDENTVHHLKNRGEKQGARGIMLAYEYPGIGIPLSIIFLPQKRQMEKSSKSTC